MDILECVKILKENKKLSNNAEIEKFEDAIENILTTNKFEYLYCGFEDATEDEEVMYGLVHAIESYYGIIQKEQYFSVFINETQKIVSEAKEWVKLMNIRILNDDESLEQYIATAQKCNNTVKNFLQDIMKEVLLEDTELFSKPVSKFINGIK
ncbi:Imm30 family immunity protein [Clostridium butyricum]|uniref:Immunity protein 30 domain-containing protein n=1 Tax=Clostridium butyricum TaxID=1492 RepID=A0AAP9UGC3_CLOBU|nr:Imm30 family immunity protein [Clostridium butyricum]MBZ5747895.1 immunity 30 family protein [Clostridium butyricum]QMW93327.1 hypothetical protein FF104_20745 [Clostridium butyricum]BBK78779.1 hypothetical protein Cbu04g_37870 [Clostridium butyricum]GEQ24995.1 hypothetical protein CBU03nite_14180 [Clostridium butyricum]